MTILDENSECGSFDGVNPKKGKTMTTEELNTLLMEVQNHPYTVGEKWYVVSQKWWKRVIEAAKQGYSEDVPPIDNSSISAKVGPSYYLKPLLAEAVDFHLLPSSVFNRLRVAYGLDDEERDFIERTVIMKGSTAVVEVYPRIVTVSLATDASKSFDLHLEGTETMTVLRKRVLTQLELNDIPIEKLRFYILNDGSHELIDPTTDNIDAYFDTAQKVVVDVKQDDGTWFIQDKPRVNAPTSSLFGPKSTAGTYGIRERVVCTTPGVCGLNNLGNTCFMASALQCLSNVPPLTEYFVSDEYMKDINIHNPLGTKGELAKAYGDLMHLMWSGEHHSIQPRKLKTTIGMFAPRFSGYAQQDSQELLAYLLDGLHEDLNRVKEKPYIEDDEHLEKMEEHEHANRAWETYRARNDSIIVDKIHGQLKSKLVCPVCAKVSIKFDPFCFLSVPLPPKERVSKQMVTVMFNCVPTKKWAKFSITITGNTTAYQAIQVMKNQLGNNGEYDDLKLVLFSVGEANDDVHILDDHSPIVSDDRDRSTAKELYAAQVDHEPSMSQLIVVKNQSTTGRVLSLPMIYTLPRMENVTKGFLQDKALKFTIETYHNRTEAPVMHIDDEMNGDEHDRDAYKMFLWDGGHLVPADKSGEELIWTSTASSAQSMSDDDFGQDIITRTVVFQWKESKGRRPLFNNFKGVNLIERECCVSQRKEIHLMDCIDLFTKQEQLGEEDSWYCPRCKKHERASKKLDLWNLPEILIIHLKRFQYSRWNREKIDIPVVIPVKGFELNSKLANERHEHVKYDLIAMSHHMGGLGGGHYTATALNKNTGKWYDFNDASACERSTPNDPLNDRSPYMLVYQRKAAVPDGAHADSNFEMETE